MAELTKFGTGTMPCEMCEEMCLDAVDGTLTAAEQAAFDRHVAGCVTCSEQLAEAQRGAAWMEMLKVQAPEPPKHLLQRILAQTSEAESSRVFADGVFHESVPTPAFRNVVPVAGWREKLWHQVELTFGLAPGAANFQSRLAMTGAMAFFSLSLTLNMAGISLGDLRPSALHRTVADASASAARSFQNLKMVYQVESKLDDLKGSEQDNASDPAGPFGKARQSNQAAPQKKQDAKPQDKTTPVSGGTSELMMPSQSWQSAYARRGQEGA